LATENCCKRWHSSGARTKRVISHRISNNLTHLTHARPAGRSAAPAWIAAKLSALCGVIVRLIGVLRTHA
jgi:hypothetical protein